MLNLILQKKNFTTLIAFLTISFLAAKDDSDNAQKLLSEALANAEIKIQERSMTESELDLFTLKQRKREARAQAKDIAEWTILTYIEGCNDLEKFFSDNLQEMARAASSSNVNVLVQMDRPHDKRTYRFKVENGKLIDAGSLNQQMGLNPGQEIYDSMVWVSKEYPAKRYFLNLSNHGGGINDRTRRSFLIPPGSEPSEEDRGVLYNDETGTFLTIDKLSEALCCIKELIGQKITLGMDACLMAMLEIGFAARNYVDVFVASVNVEAGQGWHYRDFLTKLAMADGIMTPEELGSTIVQSYQTLYSGVDPDFTLSAMHPEKLEAVRDHLSLVVNDILALKLFNKEVIFKIIDQAFADTLKFRKDYADLYSFAEELSIIIHKYLIVYGKYLDKPNFVSLVNRLEQIASNLAALKKSIKDAVIISVGGKKMLESRGVSIYLPHIFQTRPNAGYFSSEFARRSNWGNFLNIASDRTAENKNIEVNHPQQEE